MNIFTNRDCGCRVIVTSPTDKLHEPCTFHRMPSARMDSLRAVQAALKDPRAVRELAQERTAAR